jgi:hypothetical protein
VVYVRALAVLVLAPAFALGAVAGAVGIVGRPNQPTGAATSLIWAERVFPTRQSFETWLRARGADYGTWAQRHPSARVVFDSHGETRVVSVEPPAQAAKATRNTYGHSWIVALIAGISLALLVALYALRSRLTRPTMRNPWHRPAKPVALPRPRVLALAKGGHDWPVLATSATAVLRRPSSLVAAAHGGLTSRRLRHQLPTIAFYAISAALAVVIGASVVIFLQ